MNPRVLRGRQQPIEASTGRRNDERVLMETLGNKP